jgi:FMN phosphatase YigB (HAD superfamily)
VIYAFDFFGTLDTSEAVRELARQLYRDGNEIHVISALAPVLRFDYREALRLLKVPVHKIHRVGVLNTPAQKVKVLKQIEAAGFWDNSPENVEAARRAGIWAVLV